MKLSLTILLGLFLGSIVLLGLGPTPPFTPSGTAPAAQGGIPDQYASNHDREKTDGRTGSLPKFDDPDRQYSYDDYNQHGDEPGFRGHDRLTPDYEPWLLEGYVLDSEMRRMVLPAPLDSVRGLPPPPSGDRYVVLGGHVCLIDGEYRIQDTIHLEASLGR